jgi:hypothetical protein
MELFALKQWSPYVVGAGIGILNCLAFILSDRYIGCSKVFSDASAWVEMACRGKAVFDKPYYKKFTPHLDWFLMLVIGLACGAFIAAWLSGDLHFVWVPAAWELRFGLHAGFRFIVALAGGILIGLGARWAGGCTSGHGISGTIQLAVSSWLAVLCFFAGGVITAQLLFNG